MSWDAFKKSRDENPNSNFIKMKDGDSIEGIFRGEPYQFYQVFKEPDEYPVWAQGRSFTFRINFLMKENGKLVPKIFQGKSRVRDALLDVKEEYGLNCVFKIKRTGSGQDDTRYTILFKSELNKEQIEALEKIPLLSLKRETSNKNKNSDQEEPHEPTEDFVKSVEVDDDIPF